MMRSDIFYGQSFVGEVVSNPATDLPQLLYAPKWQQNGFALSPALPLKAAHKITSLYNYLDNLLPEGRARELLAQDLAVSEKHVQPQIHALGADLAGAFVFGFSPEIAQEALFRPIPAEELAQRLTIKDDIALLHWDGKPRLSMAGVQHKLNVFVTEHGDIGFGDGRLCSTHLLKFESKKTPFLVLNEFFCMTLAKAVQLQVAQVEFKRYGEHPALLVSRFDRRFDAASNKVLRRHVIDGCQALDLPRNYKYERNFGDGRDVAHIRDGASLVKLFHFCQTTTEPAANTLWLLSWQLFNLMISNYDSHGKNLSFFCGKEPNQYLFTPAYDLVNVSMFPEFNHQLAMAIGDEFDPLYIQAYQLADFADSCGLQRKLLVRTLAELGTKLLQVLDAGIYDMTRLNLNMDEIAYWEKLTAQVRARTQQLLLQANEIQGIIL